MKKVYIKFIARITVFFRMNSLSWEARLTIIEYRMLKVPSYDEMVFDKDMLNQFDIE